MKTITLHLTEVFTPTCTGCYYLDEDERCTNSNDYLDCVDNGTGQCYIFEAAYDNNS